MFTSQDAARSKAQCLHLSQLRPSRLVTRAGLSFAAGRMRCPASQEIISLLQGMK